MRRMSLTEAIEIARGYQQYEFEVPRQARHRALKKVEHAVGYPFLRRQRIFNHAVVQALEVLGQAMDSRAGTESLRREYASHHEGIAALRRDMVALQQQVRDAERRVEESEAAHRRTIAQVDLFLNSVRRSLPETPDPEALAKEPTAWDRLYNTFEDLQRGTFEEIQKRLKVYLPDLPSGRGSVLDVGCGRGEWLDLLKQHDIDGYGVDNNRDVAARAAGLGLRVETADALEHLRGVPERSLAAVTAFHVAEHLPLEVLIELIDLSLRALQPGGKLILETPNPANVAVGAHSFWLDPTHLRPLPSDLLTFLVESRGFADVETRMLHRGDPPVPTPAGEEQAPQSLEAVVHVVNHHFGAASDYAVLGTRL